MPICPLCSLGVPPSFEVCPSCGGALTKTQPVITSNGDAPVESVVAERSAAVAVKPRKPQVRKPRPKPVRRGGPIPESHALKQAPLSSKASTVAPSKPEPSFEAGQEFRRQLAERVAEQAPPPRATEEKKDRKQIMLTAVAAVLFSLLTTVAGFVVVSNSSADIARRLGLAGALTAVTYAVVAVLVSHQLVRSRFRPRLSERPLQESITFGALWGGGGAVLLASLISLIAGRPTSDPRFLGVLFEGNAIHIFALAFLAVIAAPVVEEVLFRGLVLESLRSNGRNTAILASAVLFSLWHVNPAAARYYVFMGFAFGVLYWRLGLAGSISAHFAFNGVLTVVAFLALANPVAVTSDTGVSLELPAGWVEVDAAELGPDVDLAAESPVGSALVVDHVDSPDGDVVLPPLEPTPPGFSNARYVSVAGAKSLRYETTVEGEDAYVVLVPQGPRGYALTLVPAGSDKALSQFEEILETLSFSSGG